MRRHPFWFLLVVGFTSSAVFSATQYDSGDASADEQLVLEMINRARANPTAEGTRLQIDIKEGLSSGDAADVQAKPPLAMNKILLQVARAHSKDMHDNNYFAHNSQNGKSPFQRMTEAGYQWTSAAENIAYGSGGYSAAALEDLLMVDAGISGRGHRVNLLSLNQGTREVGVGFFAGSTGRNYITQDFGASATGPFAVGVVYDDLDGDGFYDIGEGISGVTVTPSAGDFFAVTGVSGGYAFPVGATGAISLTFSGGTLSGTVTKQVTLAGLNVKVDAKKSEASGGTGGGTGGGGTGGGGTGGGGTGGGGTTVSNTKTDTDGDGFPDEVETAMGTSASSASSTPFGGSAVTGSQALTVAKLKIGLSFKSAGKDSIQLGGLLPVPENFVLAGQQVILDVGGVVAMFTLDDKGKNAPKDALKSFQLRVKKTKKVVIAQDAKWQAKLGKSDFAAKLADESLTNTTTAGTSATIPVMLFFNMQKFAADVSQVYSAKQDSSGKTSMPK